MSYQNPPWQALIAGRASNIAGNFLKKFGEDWKIRNDRANQHKSQQQKASDARLAKYQEELKKDKYTLRQNFQKAGLKNDDFFKLMTGLIDEKGAIEIALPTMSPEEQVVANARLDLIKERLVTGTDDIKTIDSGIKSVIAQEMGSDVDDIPGLNKPGGLTGVGNEEWWNRVNALEGKAFDEDGKVLPMPTFGYQKGGTEIWATRCIKADAEGKCVGKTDSFNIKELLSEQSRPGTILTIGTDQNKLWDNMKITNDQGKVSDRFLSPKVFGATSDDGKNTFDVQPTNYSKILNDYGGELVKQVAILLDSEDAKDINAAWFYYGGERASKHGAIPEKNGKIDLNSDGALLFQDMYIEMALSNNVPLYQLENIQEVIPSSVDEEALREAGVSDKEISRRQQLQKDTSWEGEGNIKQDRKKYQAPIQAEQKSNIKPVKGGESKSKNKSINQITSLIKNAGVKIRKDKLGGNAILKMIQENPRQYGLTGTQLEKILTTAKVANPKNKSKNNPYGLNTSGNSVEDIKRVLELIPSIKKVLSPQEVSDLVDQQFKKIEPSEQQVNEVLDELRAMVENRK
jgi:hypothetical protein